MRKMGLDYKYEPFKLPYVLERTYCPDFIIDNVLIEVKGLLDQDTRSKMLAVKKAHPDLDIRFIFMRADNKLSKNSKTTYGEWATKNGFLWADGSVPVDWFSGK